MKKINIAELLKNCPKGMELDCTMYDNVQFNTVQDKNFYPIKIDTPEGRISLTKEGCYSLNPHCKCVIFPKGKTTWDGFIPPFKDGDIITCTNSICTFVAIYKCMCDKNSFYRYACLILNGWSMNGKMHFKPDTDLSDFANPRFATEEERQKLFEAIKENGYQWNAEIKTLQKVITLKFKIGDNIKLIGKNTYARIVGIRYEENEVYYETLLGDISIKDQDNYELLVPVVPKFKVGDRIRHRLTGDVYKVCLVLSNGCGGGVYDVEVTNELGKSIDIKEQDNYELVPEKFDVSILKPFDRVLVRDTNENCWHTDFYSHYTGTYFYTANGLYAQCVPYEGNEHLLGTKNDCADYYKTW